MTNITQSCIIEEAQIQRFVVLTPLMTNQINHYGVVMNE